MIDVTVWINELSELSISHPDIPNCLSCIPQILNYLVASRFRLNQINHQISWVKSPEFWFWMSKIQLNPQLKWYFRASDNSNVYIYIYILYIYIYIILYIIIHLNHWYKPPAATVAVVPGVMPPWRYAPALPPSRSLRPTATVLGGFATGVALWPYGWAKFHDFHGKNWENPSKNIW